MDNNGTYMQSPHFQEASHETRLPFSESYVPAPGGGSTDSLIKPPVNADGEFKVEIPNSGTSYQPSAPDTATELGNGLPMATHMQQQGPYILPAGFQLPASFLMPSAADMYQAAMMSTAANAANAANAASANDYADGIPDIWEAAELGDVPTVQLHLNNGVSPDQRNNSRST
ncbi:hypothetical protein BGZ65_012536, partial [Modicella reniformis]